MQPWHEAERVIGMLTAGMSTRAVAREYFFYHKPSPKAFQRIWQYIQPASQPQTTWNHTSPGPTHPASSRQRSSETATRTATATIGLHNQRIYAQTVRNTRLREAHLHARCPYQGLDLTALRRRNRLEWANAHIRWRLALWRGVLFTDESRFALYSADGRQHVWRRVGERFADVNIVDWVAHGGVGVMVRAGVCYGQRIQVHFIDGILNAQRYRDEILRPIVVPFIHDITSCCSMIMHSPMLQGSVHNSWKLKTSQLLHGQHTHRTCHPLSMFGMLWIGVYDSVFQFLPISSNFAQPLKRSGPSFHRPQSTTWSTLCEGDALHCLRQMVVTPDTDWFSDTPNTVKLHILEWSFIVASLRHTCAIIMLSNQHLDMPHLWGGWIISAKEKYSLTQI